MSTHSNTFKYKTLDELKEACALLDLKLDFSDNIRILAQKVRIGCSGQDKDHRQEQGQWYRQGQGHEQSQGSRVLPNSLAYNPMEGCDGLTDGSPGELTFRRYERLAAGGAGLIWLEAVAVVPEGRSNPRHLWINKGNVSEFERLASVIRETAYALYGRENEPAIIMQLTHAGRYSRPLGRPEPIIAAHNPYLDAAQKLDPDLTPVTDDYIEMIEDKFAEAALLARKAGFDGVDVKACHRYLASELLSAFDREGYYGGSFEGRTRFLLNTIDKIKEALGSNMIVTTRLNVYDGIHWPYGWGTDREDHTQCDLSEPLKLAGLLCESGVGLMNVTMGNPYYNPHINRPYDKGSYIPPEHPLTGVARLMRGAAKIQKAYPDMAVVGSGYTWLRNFAQYLAAGSIEKGYARIAGFGRQAFAYPDFARDIIYGGGMKKDKCCICCGKCTEIMRGGGTTGCAVRDAAVYQSIWNGIYCR